MNSPSPNTLSSLSGFFIAAASTTAPACSNGVAGTQDGIINLMLSAVSSDASSI